MNPEIQIINDVAPFELFKRNGVHVVCPANGGLTYCDTYAMSKGMKQQEIWDYTKKVNDLNEVGTFYPKLYLTVIPLTKWNKRNIQANDLPAFFKLHLMDVFKAHNTYIKSDKIHFILNDSPRNLQEDVAFKELNKLLYNDKIELEAKEITVFEIK